MPVGFRAALLTLPLLCQNAAVLLPIEPPVLAAFDFDGTLTRGGSVWPFLAAVGGRRALWIAAWRLSPRLLIGILLGGRHADAAKEALFRAVLRGVPAATAEQTAATFGRQHLARHARADVLARLHAHAAAGHRLAIVSASPELYLRGVAADLGVDLLIATRLAVGPDGRLTGGYDGPNCRGQEKLRRLRAAAVSLAPATGGAGVVLWAYGNSAGDHAMLGGVDLPVAVGRLGRIGRLRRFPQLRQAPVPEIQDIGYRNTQ